MGIQNHTLGRMFPKLKLVFLTLSCLFNASYSSPVNQGLKSIDSLSSSGTCDDGWISFYGKCFYFSPKGADVNWDEAQSICTELGGTLAEPRTATLDGFFSEQFTQMSHLDGGQTWWLGATDLEQEGRWKWWSDGA